MGRGEIEERGGKEDWAVSELNTSWLDVDYTKKKEKTTTTKWKCITLYSVRLQRNL